MSIASWKLLRTAAVGSVALGALMGDRRFVALGVCCEFLSLPEYPGECRLTDAVIAANPIHAGVIHPGISPTGYPVQTRASRRCAQRPPCS